jgi:hypothetical protein
MRNENGTSYVAWVCGITMLKGDSRLASSHLEIFVSLFQPATIVSNPTRNSCFKSLKQLLRVGTRICVSQAVVAVILHVISDILLSDYIQLR